MTSLFGGLRAGRIMETVVWLAVWFVVSLPVALLVGAWVATPGD